MFSKKTVVIIGVIFLIIANLLILSVVSQRHPAAGPGGWTISLLAPFQNVISGVSRFVRGIWHQYFALVNTAEENLRLRQELSRAAEMKNAWVEARLDNARLRRMVGLDDRLEQQVVFAEVIAQDPTAWFKTVIINKGRRDGIAKGMPAVVPEGIVGQVTDVAEGYAKILLMIDPNSAVDALIQRNRVRGLIKGDTTDRCRLELVLLKEDVEIGDTVITSGLDGVFPKGLRAGVITAVEAPPNEMFHLITIKPFVDYEKLEALLVILVAPIEVSKAVP